VANTPFGISGTFTNTNPTFGALVYADDGQGSTPVPLQPGSVEVSNFSYIHSGFSTPGLHSVTIYASDGSSATSNTFNVIAAKTIVINPIVGVVTGQLFTFSGTLGGYGSAPGIVYSLDGAPTQPVTGVTATGWSMRLSGPGADIHTIVVTDPSAVAVSASVTFVVGGVAKLIVPMAPTGAVAGQTVTFMGTLSGYTTVPTLTFSFDGGVTKSPLNGVTTTGWSTQVVAPIPAGTYTVLVSDGTVSGSVPFAVVAAPKTITIAAIANATAGTTIAFTGTLTGFIAVPTLTYSLDGGSATAVTGVVQTGWSMTLTAPSAGAHTITVTDAADSITTPATNFTTTAVVKAILPASPLGTVAGVVFTFTGTLTGFGVSTPTLTYSVDGAAPISLTGVTPTGWSESITVATAGAHTITVTDAADNLTGSATFSTVAQTIKTISPAAPGGTTQDIAFTFTGTLAGYSIAPLLVYRLNNGAPVTMTGVTATGWSMVIAVGPSGSNTLTVADPDGNAGSVTFTTATATRTIVPVAPLLPVEFSNFTFTGTYNGYSAAPLLQYKIDSGPYITMTGVVENPDVAGLTWMAAGYSQGGNGSEVSLATRAGQPGNVMASSTNYNNYYNYGSQTGSFGGLEQDWTAWATAAGGNFNGSRPFDCYQITFCPMAGYRNPRYGFNPTDFITRTANMQAMANDIQAKSTGIVIANPGWEWNSGGYNDIGFDDLTQATLYITWFRTYARILKATAPNVIIGWIANSTLMRSGTLADYYPGSDLVDAVGIECYAGVSTQNGGASTVISTTDLNNNWGWATVMSAKPFLGPNHPAKTAHQQTVNGVLTNIPAGSMVLPYDLINGISVKQDVIVQIPITGPKYIAIPEWQDNGNDPDFVTNAFAWSQDSAVKGRVLLMNYWQGDSQGNGSPLTNSNAQGDQWVTANTSTPGTKDRVFSGLPVAKLS
jgi:hypothetical protein